MAKYISSIDNRYYAATETAFGIVPTIAAANRLPGVSLQVGHSLQKIERKDKTGGRTFTGLPQRLRSTTDFKFRTYLTSWNPQAGEPPTGALVQAGLGAAPLIHAGGTVEAAESPTRIRFAAQHNLSPGQAIRIGSELRFVAEVADERTVEVNAPFTFLPGAGTPTGRTVTYAPGSELGSVSIFDYWSPTGGVQRIVRGGAVDQVKIQVNGDFHELHFAGVAADLLDSGSFTAGLGGLSAFPDEPTVSALDYAVVPGHVGQAWVGAVAPEALAVTSAEMVIDNDVDLRAREFGSMWPKGIIPGRRSVRLALSIYAMDDASLADVYQAARNRTPIPVMFQLGEQPGQLCGVYMKSVVPSVPEFDDSERRLKWVIDGSRAQGTIDDEVAIAFG